jgi:hypothetical protein
MLRRLEANQHDYDLLLRSQREIVRLIRRSERRISELKLRSRALHQQKSRGRLSKHASQLLKQSIERVRLEIATARHLLFLWRCFGDGIAFVYLDKYALKHMLYNTHDYSVKQVAGAISNKEGFKLEWNIVRGLAKKQIPAMLCDITNTIRHGDVCALVGPDPLPIEVKSSANRNERVARQLASVDALNKFIATDKATNFRGQELVRRVALPLPETNYASAMNECIERSKRTGFAAIRPEDGLTYMCIRSTEAVERLAEQPLGPHCIVTCVNEPNGAGTWMPYYPFTLSIREPQALYEFINGDITLIVILDALSVIKQFAAKGLHAQFVEHPGVVLFVSKSGAVRNEDPFSTISTDLFSRLFYEFESIKLLIDTQLFLFESVMPEMEEENQERIVGGGTKSRKWPEYKLPH